MTEFTSELFGTLLLILLGNGVVANVVLQKTKAHNGGWIVIAFGWGLAVMVGVYAAGKFSGAHLNPAVTLSLAAAGLFDWADVPLYVAGQLAGATLGALLVFAHFLPHFKATNEPETTRAVFCTAPAIRHTPSNFLSEFLGTFALMFGLMAIGANAFAEGLNPLIVGLLIVSIGLSMGGTTGYAINPARDFGPRLMHALLPIPNKGVSDWKYAWIPIVGPIFGGLYGTLTYQYFLGGHTQFLGGVLALTVCFVALLVLSYRRFK